MRIVLRQKDENYFFGLTTKLYEQLDAYPTQGSFRIYFDANDPAQPARGHAYGFFAGTFSVADDCSAKFSARGKLLGGSGAISPAWPDRCSWTEASRRRKAAAIP